MTIHAEPGPDYHDDAPTDAPNTFDVANVKPDAPADEAHRDVEQADIGERIAIAVEATLLAAAFIFTVLGFVTAPLYMLAHLGLTLALIVLLWAPAGLLGRIMHREPAAKGEG
jgi:hypothetical protein